MAWSRVNDGLSYFVCKVYALFASVQKFCIITVWILFVSFKYLHSDRCYLSYGDFLWLCLFYAFDPVSNSCESVDTAAFVVLTLLMAVATVLYLI